MIVYMDKWRGLRRTTWKNHKNLCNLWFNNLSAAARIIYLFSTDIIMLIHGGESTGDWSRDPKTEKLVRTADPSDPVPGLKLTYIGTFLKDTSELDDFSFSSPPYTPTHRHAYAELIWVSKLCLGCVAEIVRFRRVFQNCTNVRTGLNC